MDISDWGTGKVGILSGEQVDIKAPIPHHSRLDGDGPFRLSPGIGTQFLWPVSVFKLQGHFDPCAERIKLLRQDRRREQTPTDAGISCRERSSSISWCLSSSCSSLSWNPAPIPALASINPQWLIWVSAHSTRWTHEQKNWCQPFQWTHTSPLWLSSLWEPYSTRVRVAERRNLKKPNQDSLMRNPGQVSYFVPQFSHAQNRILVRILKVNTCHSL